MRCQIVISTVGNEIIIFGTYTPLGLVIHWYALPPVSVHDDAAPVAPSIPAKETRVRKGKRRSGERRRRRGDGGPSFCLIHIQSSAAAPPPRLCFFLHRSCRPSPSSLAPRSCYRYIRRSDRQIPSPPRRRREQCLPPSLLPSSLPPRVSNDSCRGGK